MSRRHMDTRQGAPEPDAALHSHRGFLWLQTVALETNRTSPLFTSTEKMIELCCYHALVSFSFRGLKVCSVCFFLSVQELPPKHLPMTQWVWAGLGRRLGTERGTWGCDGEGMGRGGEISPHISQHMF